MWDEWNDNEMRRKKARTKGEAVCVYFKGFPLPWASRRQHFFGLSQARAKMKGKKRKFRSKKNAQPGCTAD